MKHDRDYLIHTGSVLDKDGGIPVTEIHEVTRCKDCKHHDTVSLNCEYLAATTLDNWYCWNGERRADNEAV